MRSIILLLALSLLVSASPQDQSTQDQGPQNPGSQEKQDTQNQGRPPAPTAVTTTTIATTTTAATTTTNPNALPLPANIVQELKSLYSDQLNNPLFAAIGRTASPGGIPRASAALQEKAYNVALATATGPVPQPAYMSGLPDDQRRYLQNYHSQIANVWDQKGKVSSKPPANRTVVAASSGGGARARASATGGGTGIPIQPPPTVAEPAPVPGNAAGARCQPAGVYKMAGAAALGLLGIAAFL
ncbi:MAG: hypothetical protein Q9185_006604 [Variospora sp. 1 TL-2023]